MNFTTTLRRLKRLSSGMILLLVASLLFTLSCRRSDTLDFAPLQRVRIAPQITRVEGINFEEGDRIGLTIRPEGEVYCDNAPLTYNGSHFESESLHWYTASDAVSTLDAYYPYNESGTPTTFTVSTDQSTSDAYESSDLLAAQVTGITPTEEAVDMTFSHLMTQVVIDITNLSGQTIRSVSLEGTIPSASLDLSSRQVTAFADASPVAITPFEVTAGAGYRLVVVPQTATLTLKVTTSDEKTHSQTFTETPLAAGSRYTIRTELTAQRLHATLSGQITDWIDQGEILPQPAPEEGDGTPGEESGEGSGGETSPGEGDPSTGDGTTGGENGDSTGENTGGDNVTGDNTGTTPVPDTQTITILGESYGIQTLSDGTVWMAENLRSIPAGFTVSSNPKTESGLWYPCTTDKQASTDAGFIRDQGLLYALSTALGTAITTDNYATLSGVQGLCPAGWHLPTKADFEALRTLPLEELHALLVSTGRRTVDGEYAGQKASGSTGAFQHGYLLGTTSVQATFDASPPVFYYLKYFTVGTAKPSLVEYDARAGVAVRCVKDR